MTRTAIRSDLCVILVEICLTEIYRRPMYCNKDGLFRWNRAPKYSHLFHSGTVLAARSVWEARPGRTDVDHRSLPLD
jgi:hypothetical protein